MKEETSSMSLTYNLVVELDQNIFLHKKILASKKFYFIIKRLIDIMLSVILIILFSPIMLVVSIIIKISSKGDILYKHVRVGYNNNFFTMFKFRSMKTILSLKEIKRINDYQNNGKLYKSDNDPRLTKCGRIIRKTSIDELPQLFNVILGDMSLVGPRPLVPFMADPYPEISSIRTCVKPGITGMWQVFSRNKNTSILDMIQWDLEYIYKCSIIFDLYLLLKTIPTIISNNGAI